MTQIRIVLDLGYERKVIYGYTTEIEEKNRWIWSGKYQHEKRD